MQQHSYERVRKKLEPVLKSKLEEFVLLGYGEVSEQELWNYLLVKKWNKVKGDSPLYEIVADIMSVQVGEYMNFATIEAFKLGNYVLDNEEERRELLK